MPIPTTELDKAQRSLSERILEFLSRDPQKAFTLAEIFVGIEGEDLSSGVAREVLAILAHQQFRRSVSKSLKYRRAITPLVEEGKVREGEVHGITYYARRVP